MPAMSGPRGRAMTDTSTVLTAVRKWGASVLTSHLYLPPASLLRLYRERRCSSDWRAEMVTPVTGKT